MSDHNNSSEHSDNGRKLHLTIVTPVGKWQHPFDPSTTVSTVIAETFDHFNGKLNPSDPYELQRKDTGVALDPAATLASLGIEDRETLLLVKCTVGGGK